MKSVLFAIALMMPTLSFATEANTCSMETFQGTLEFTSSADAEGTNPQTRNCAGEMVIQRSPTSDREGFASLTTNLKIRCDDGTTETEQDEYWTKGTSLYGRKYSDLSGRSTFDKVGSFSAYENGDLSVVFRHWASDSDSFDFDLAISPSRVLKVEYKLISYTYGERHHVLGSMKLTGSAQNQVCQ
jgi:hypothetical protein